MQKSGAGLFLMELTIALLFFSLAAAVCLQLFVKTHTLNGESRNAGDSHIIATSIADDYRAGNLDNKIKDGENTILYYDSNYYETDENGVIAYIAYLTCNNGTLDISVKIPDEETEYYSLSVYKYVPEVTK
ncbi:MAG: hypothetical protein KBS96_04275 [Lachnospiraceae bacterium]|nr:hypothetical protein [Candidatus Colinaster scatohippi]